MNRKYEYKQAEVMDIKKIKQKRFSTIISLTVIILLLLTVINLYAAYSYIQQTVDLIGSLVLDSNIEIVEKMKKEVLQNSIPYLIFCGLFVLITFTIFITFQYFYRKEERSQVGDAEVTYQVEFQSMLHTMRSIRHDFINHIQVIQGLLCEFFNCRSGNA